MITEADLIMAAADLVVGDSSNNLESAYRGAYKMIFSNKQLMLSVNYYSLLSWFNNNTSRLTRYHNKRYRVKIRRLKRKIDGFKQNQTN